MTRLSEPTGLVAEQEAFDAVSRTVHGAIGPGDQRLVLLVSIVAPTSYQRLRAFNPDGSLRAAGERFNSVRVPLEATIALKTLRAASYREGVGTWFGLELTVMPDGTARAVYNYDDEPEWDAPVDSVVYQADLNKFPREEQHRPAWLKQTLVEAEATS